MFSAVFLTKFDWLLRSCRVVVTSGDQDIIRIDHDVLGDRVETLWQSGVLLRGLEDLQVIEMAPGNVPSHQASCKDVRRS